MAAPSFQSIQTKILEAMVSFGPTFKIHKESDHLSSLQPWAQWDKPRFIVEPRNSSPCFHCQLLFVSSWHHSKNNTLKIEVRSCYFPNGLHFHLKQTSQSSQWPTRLRRTYLSLSFLAQPPSTLSHIHSLCHTDFLAVSWTCWEWKCPWWVVFSVRSSLSSNVNFLMKTSLTTLFKKVQVQPHGPLYPSCTALFFSITINTL